MALPAIHGLFTAQKWMNFSNTFDLTSMLSLKVVLSLGIGILVYRSVEERRIINVTIKRHEGHSVPPSNQVIKIKQGNGKTVYVRLKDLD